MVPTNTPDRIEVITSFVINAITKATNGGRIDRNPASTGSIDAKDCISVLQRMFVRNTYQKHFYHYNNVYNTLTFKPTPVYYTIHKRSKMNVD